MKKLLAFVLSAFLLAGASVSVFADDVAAAEETAVAEPLTIEGAAPVKVTTSDTNMDVDVANFYDALPETKCTITFDADEETKTLSVYTATKVPEALTNFAAIVDGEKGTVITMEVYGTNDSLLLEWNPLIFSLTDQTADPNYAIFSIVDNTTAYAFYRFDFTLELGDYFELSELALFKAPTDAPEMEYDLGDVVEAGEMPALVPVEAEEAAEPAEAAAVEEVEEETAGVQIVLEEVPTFGLFTKFPMPMYKFLPRG